MAFPYSSFTDFLWRSGIHKTVYEAIENNEGAEAVSKIIDIIKKINIYTSVYKEFKSEEQSTQLRKEGNAALKLNLLSDTLELYNKALCYAPMYSRAMKLAYSNRSALLYKTGHFEACLKDIEKCMSLVCPDDIVEKLKKRKIDCFNKLQKTTIDKFIKNFFLFNVERNPSIPSASSMVEVITEQQSPKVVAAKDIHTGTVLVVEPAFVSEVVYRFAYVSCYYCQKISLNLDPCRDCSMAMFCCKDCQDKCMQDYHCFECVLTSLLKSQLYNSYSLYVKTVIKIKSSFDSWNEFILAIDNIEKGCVKDQEIVEGYTTSEIYDGNNKYSPMIFCKDTSQILQYGTIYNAAVFFAIMLYELIKCSSFFPKEEAQKRRALDAVSRLLMYFATCKPNIFKNAVSTDDLLVNSEAVFVSGYYPFISKLAESCRPNVYSIQLNGKLALIAIGPIKKGTELIHSRMMWADTNGEIRRAAANYKVYKIACKCQVCLEDWNYLTAFNQRSNLSDKHKSYLHRANLLEVCENLKKRYKLQDCYKKICEGLTTFADVPHTSEFAAIFALFRDFTNLVRKADN